MLSRLNTLHIQRKELGHKGGQREIHDAYMTEFDKTRFPLTSNFQTLSKYSVSYSPKCLHNSSIA